MAYTAGDLLVQARMRCITGLPADEVINDFAFQFPGAITDADIDAAFAAVDEFYRTAVATTATVSEYISNYVDRAQTHELAAYKIQAPPIGSPLRVDAWIGPSTAGTTIGLPSEVSGVLSYHALLTGVLEESGATHPRARRRGRLFIGPLTNVAIDNSVPPYRLNNAGFLTTLRQAAVRLMDDTDTKWCVWSRADATLREVVGGWTDNAPDTQRRRGVAATARVTWG